MTSLSSYTLSFWIFMIDDFFSSIKGNRLCPLLQKGRDDIVSNNYRRSPSIILDRKTKQLKVYISTTKSNSVEGESFISNSRIYNQRWIHIALVKNKNKVALLVNGVVDTEFVLQGGPVEDTGDLYLGGVKWLSGFCQFPFLIDEFKYFDTALEFNLIQAEAAGALAGLQSDLLKFGCRDCGIEEANRSCSGEYRLCTTIELHTGGYQISRSLGWLDWNTHIWTHSAVKKTKEYANKKGLALCCRELSIFDQ